MTLKDYLEHTGLSYEEFGRQIGKTKQAVCGYVGFVINPQLETAVRIVKATDNKVTILDLIPPQQRTILERELYGSKK